ncbi:hypothetical protein PHET_03691 [Paragonimus heterotremus]|uniref:ETS domain-containing protein n=1 Tax=Paragonimus heterotremus TaxID=100268 RepID=A0A8J4WS21_9TREM|nr:hypothetical protein PHET_03691 [Paragonimus heterotremus]
MHFGSTSVTPVLTAHNLVVRSSSNQPVLDSSVSHRTDVDPLHTPFFWPYDAQLEELQTTAYFGEADDESRFGWLNEDTTTDQWFQPDLAYIDRFPYNQAWIMNDSRNVCGSPQSTSIMKETCIDTTMVTKGHSIAVEPTVKCFSDDADKVLCTPCQNSYSLSAAPVELIHSTTYRPRMPEQTDLNDLSTTRTMFSPLSYGDVNFGEAKPTSHSRKTSITHQTKVRHEIACPRSLTYTATRTCNDAMMVAASAALANFHHRGSLQLWQFLVALLDDTKSQHLICWTGRTLEFKLNDPEEVARLWGIQKNRPAMNYDKLSRSLRYYYEKGIMQKVSGERYVYRFVYEPDILFALAFPGEEQQPTEHPDSSVTDNNSSEESGLSVNFDYTRDRQLLVSTVFPNITQPTTCMPNEDVDINRFESTMTATNSFISGTTLAITAPGQLNDELNPQYSHSCAKYWNAFSPLSNPSSIEMSFKRTTDDPIQKPSVTELDMSYHVANTDEPTHTKQFLKASTRENVFQYGAYLPNTRQFSSLDDECTGTHWTLPISSAYTTTSLNGTHQCKDIYRIRHWSRWSPTDHEGLNTPPGFFTTTEDCIMSSVQVEQNKPYHFDCSSNRLIDELKERTSLSTPAPEMTKQPFNEGCYQESCVSSLNHSDN